MWCVYVPQKAAARFPFLWVSRHLILQRREGIRDQVSDLTSNTSNKFSTKVICWTLCAKKNCSAKCQHKRTGKFLNSIPILLWAAIQHHESSTVWSERFLYKVALPESKISPIIYFVMYNQWCYPKYWKSLCH